MVTEPDLINDELVNFDLQAELRDFEAARPWHSGIHSKPLTKRPHLRVVLIAMDSQAQMREHHADGTVTLHILKGSTRVKVLDQDLVVESGHLLVINPSIKHSVSAQQNCAFLLSIASPPEVAGLAHRGRGYGA